MKNDRNRLYDIYNILESSIIKDKAQILIDHLSDDDIKLISRLSLAGISMALVNSTNFQNGKKTYNLLLRGKYITYFVDTENIMVKGLKDTLLTPGFLKFTSDEVQAEKPSENLINSKLIRAEKLAYLSQHDLPKTKSLINLSHHNLRSFEQKLDAINLSSLKNQSFTNKQLSTIEKRMNDNILRKKRQFYFEKNLYKILSEN